MYGEQTYNPNPPYTPPGGEQTYTPPVPPPPVSYTPFLLQDLQSPPPTWDSIAQVRDPATAYLQSLLDNPALPSSMYGTVANTRNTLNDILNPAVNWGHQGIETLYPSLSPSPDLGDIYQQALQPTQDVSWQYQQPSYLTPPPTAPSTQPGTPMSWPVDQKFGITSPFGAKDIAQHANGHSGVDFGAPAGTPVYLPAGGKVISISSADHPDNGYGLAVRVQLPDGKVLLFGHLSSVGVSVGQDVAAGAQVALSGGNTGDWRQGVSTGAHLHFGLYENGVAVDPMPWLQGNGTYTSQPGGTYTPQTSEPTSPPSGKWTANDSINAIRYYYDKYAQQYGMTPGFLQFVFGIAISESNLDPYAHGDTTLGGTGSWGIFQFYTGGGRGTGVPVDQLTNPYYQARVNLPILWQAYQKAGGDAAWNSPNRLGMFTQAYWDGQRGVRSIIDQRAPGVLQQLDSFVGQHPDVFGGGPYTPQMPGAQTLPQPIGQTLPWMNLPQQMGQNPAMQYLSSLFGGGSQGYSADPAMQYLESLLGR